MLKVMRDSFKHLKWILILIVAAFIVMVFVDWGGAGAQGQVSNQTFVARVNGEIIPVDEYRRTMFLTERQYEQAYGQALTPETRQAMGLPQLVINNLIEQKLLLQEAERLNLAATEEEVRARILEIPTLNPNGEFVGAELYQRYVTSTLGYPSAAQFEKELEREITLTKINSALLASVTIPDKRAEEEYRRRNESARIRYVLYPASRLLPSIQVTPQEVEEFYRKNATSYTHPAQRNVTYLLADLARIRSQVKVDESELRSRYEAARASYRQPEGVKAQHILITLAPGAPAEEAAAARRKAEDVLARARAGADFTELARQNSQEPGAAETGGDLGFFSRGQMVPEFENAAFSMQPGEISDIVQTQFGLHVIKVNERRDESFRSFEEVRPELEARLVDERVKAQAREAITAARARLEHLKPITPEDMQSVAGQTVTYNSGGWFGKNDPLEGLGRAPAINDWAFNTAKVGETSPVLDTQRGPVVAYVVGERPAGVSPLDEIRARVENEAKLEKARAGASQELQGIWSSLGSIDGVGQTLSIAPQEAAVTRMNPVPGLSGSTRGLVDAVFGAKQGQTGGPLIVDDGALVFQVLEERKFDPAQYQAQKQSILDMLRQNEFRNLRVSLIEKLRSEAEVAVNQQLLEAELGGTPLAGM